MLLSNSTPLSTGPLTNEELSWIGMHSSSPLKYALVFESLTLSLHFHGSPEIVGSISSMGSICGTFICGILSMLFGCKRAMTFLAFPPIIFWLSVLFGNTYFHLLLGRFAAGLNSSPKNTHLIDFWQIWQNNNFLNID